MQQPPHRCSNPEDANWAAPGVYFNWAWNGYLLGAPMTGPDGGTVADWIDKTLSYGFGRVTGLLPANTFGGYPCEGFWSTAAFVNNIASASAGTVDNGAGAVTIPAHTRSVTVTLAHAPTAT